MNISTVIADMSYEQQLKTDVSYHYHETTLPPLKFMPNLWEFIEKALHNSCTLTIKNTNLLSGVKNNQESDTLNVICIEYIKITEENDKEYIELIGEDSKYWITKQGAYVLFEDEYYRQIPMLIYNTTIPFIITIKETEERFNCIDYKPEIATKIADETLAVTADNPFVRANKQSLCD